MGQTYFAAAQWSGTGILDWIIGTGFLAVVGGFLFGKVHRPADRLTTVAMLGSRWRGAQSGVAVDNFEFDDWAEPVRLLAVADDAAEFGARLDAELAVDTGQIGFDSLRADEQCGRDVAIGHP
jgi:hypothetical protein